VEKIVQFSELIAPKPSAINQKRNDYRGKTGAKNCTRARKKPGARSATGSPRSGGMARGKPAPGRAGQTRRGKPEPPRAGQTRAGWGAGSSEILAPGVLELFLIVSRGTERSGDNTRGPPAISGRGKPEPPRAGQTRTPEGRANPNPRGRGKPGGANPRRGGRGKPAPGRAGKTGTGEGGANPTADGRWPPGVVPGYHSL
jgi:hypothetical protein